MMIRWVAICAVSATSTTLAPEMASSTMEPLLIDSEFIRREQEEYAAKIQELQSRIADLKANPSSAQVQKEFEELHAAGAQRIQVLQSQIESLKADRTTTTETPSGEGIDYGELRRTQASRAEKIGALKHEVEYLKASGVGEEAELRFETLERDSRALDELIESHFAEYAAEAESDSSDEGDMRRTDGRADWGHPEAPDALQLYSQRHSGWEDKSL